MSRYSPEGFGSGLVPSQPLKTCPRIQTRSPLVSASANSSATNLNMPLLSGFWVLLPNVNRLSMIFRIHLHVIQQIAMIPEISVECDDPQFRVCRMIDGVSSVVNASLHGSFSADPIVLLPQSGDVIPVPRSMIVSQKSPQFRHTYC
jgi:hypothetical protein